MPDFYIGIMSGTSLDGIDAVIASPYGARLRLLASCHRPYPAALRKQLLGLNRTGPDEFNRAALLANALSAQYAAATRMLLSHTRVGARAVTAIGCHGQTVRHRPGAGYTLQLVNGAELAELTGIAVVCDFRSRDIAAGGEGAPLVPAFHEAMFRDARRNRAIVNVGGIANVTYLPVGDRVNGFDCGPGNVLLDAWIHHKLGKRYDAGGAWAARGSVLPRLLLKLLSHPFIRRRPPKSTGRDEFSLRWIKRILSGGERAVDVQATLLEFTAVAIARAVRTRCPKAREIYLCGGGARNGALASRLSALLSGMTVAATDDLGIAAEHVEALAFAWLARRALKGEPGNLPAVTGARGRRVLGAIYPR